MGPALVRTGPFLLAIPLFGALLTPPSACLLLTLAVITLFGVPHGALDVELGRAWLRPRYGHGWFLIFALPYLMLAALVIGCWCYWPEPTLAVFLLMSIAHFGWEDAGRGLPALAMGGIPIIVPVLCQPVATMRIFSVIAGLDLATVPLWLLAISVVWIGAMTVWLARAPAVDRWRSAGLIVLFALVPPLTAFALYFVVLHAPAHVAAMVREWRASTRICSIGTAWRLSVAPTLMTIGLALLLRPIDPQPTEPTGPILLRLTFRMLSALTLPHMVFEWWLTTRSPIWRGSNFPPVEPRPQPA